MPSYPARAAEGRAPQMGAAPRYLLRSTAAAPWLPTTRAGRPIAGAQPPPAPSPQVAATVPRQASREDVPNRLPAARAAAPSSGAAGCDGSLVRMQPCVGAARRPPPASSLAPSACSPPRRAASQVEIPMATSAPHDLLASTPRAMAVPPSRCRRRALLPDARQLELNVHGAWDRPRRCLGRHANAQHRVCVPGGRACEVQGWSRHAPRGLRRQSHPCERTPRGRAARRAARDGTLGLARCARHGRSGFEGGAPAGRRHPDDATVAAADATALDRQMRKRGSTHVYHKTTCVVVPKVKSF